METFKNINDKYQISDCGNVKNIKTGKILKPQLQSNGYYNITMVIDGKKKTYNIHRLVASVFIKNPFCFNCVNHKDGNKLNNNINNLEWCNKSYNIKHAYKNGLRKKFRKKNKNNTSGKVGVIFDKSINKWIARLHKNRNPIYLGSFDKKEDAIKLRIEAERNIDNYK